MVVGFTVLVVWDSGFKGWGFSASRVWDLG